ncbi:MAG: hypothetical protein WBG01_02535 [Bacteroidota bacterium]|jgi:hypothetical protein
MTGSEEMKSNRFPPPSGVTAETEADHLLELFGGQPSRCIEFLRHHFDVIQARSHLLLTLGTLALTITGFSGPKIAQTNLFARYSMAFGIVFVLSALVILLLGSLRIRWTTQIMGSDARETLSRIIRYRNQKTRLYFLELTLLVIGLTSYVASIVTYLMVGP